MMKALKKRRKGGFTLIELVVVIAILGILAIIAIPRLTGFSSQAKLNANENSLATLQSVVNIYVADTGNLPTTLASLQTEKYLGTGVTPKGPKITTYTTKGAFDAATGDYFVLTVATGVVSIGTPSGTTVVAISSAATQ